MDRYEPSFAHETAEQAATTALAHWMLKAAPFPALVIDNGARILYTNTLARSVLETSDGMDARYGVLALMREQDQKRFERTLASASHAEPAVIRLERPSGRRAYALTLFRAPAPPTTEPMWVVLISDTSERISLQPRWIEAMFDVTRGEARVLALVSAGMSAEDIGSTLQIATATVRVHLRNVYRKLKINRQSDLVATILQAIMPMCACEAARDSLRK